MSTINKHAVGEPIAIIGTGCRFPGDSTSPSKLWQLLSEPRDLLQSIDDRFSSEGWYHENGKHHGHLNVKQSYLLAGKGVHRRFDASFFGVNAVEANTMDPQMRLLLETVYEALEAAGQPIESLRGSNTAVYSGMMTNSYKANMERDLDSIGTYHVSGASRAMMSNRLSFFFDWHGPSITIDTACSSSLIAVHQAVMQLRTGQSRFAIAAGSNLLLDPTDYVAMCNLEMLSPEGRSRMWDRGANGYARGEGVAAVVLKTLSAAEADGDHIECIIRETATNQDGRTPGITMPSATAQVQLIRDCYARAGLDPTDPRQRPQYFEAHGTGTQAGDPVEAEAIQSAFFPSDDIKRDPLLVGSIKTVIGHAESTSGLAGLIKASLALQNSIVPPNLLFSELNPKLKPYYKDLRIPTSPATWPLVASDRPRRASVNSFGFGGANAHAILESYMPVKRPKGTLAPCFIPFVFSAASESSLSSNLSLMSEHLRRNCSDIEMRDLALTLHSRRSRHKFGTAIAASTIPDLCNKLEERVQKASSDAERRAGVRSQERKILGVFTGQGAQSARMAAALIEESHYCQQIIERLETRLSRLPKADRPSWSLKQELLSYDNARVGQATLSQPLCTALQILHVELLRAAGVEFSAVVGHSSGEIGAAYSAGMISAEDAICIAYYRGLHSGLATGSDGQRGAMMAVGTSFVDVQELCNEDEFHGRVSVAAINSSASVTVSGDEDAIEEMKVILEDEEKFVRHLKVDKAYHSHHMNRCSTAYLNALDTLGIQIQQPTTPWFSSVDSGKEMAAEASSRLQGPYWNDNMVQTVMFMQAVQGAWESHGAFDMVVEVGPHPTLKGPTLQTIQELSQQKPSYTGTHNRGDSAMESFANSLGNLWTHVPHVNLASFDKLIGGVADFKPIMELPTYTWDHEKEFWHESRYSKAIRTRADPPHELLGHLTPDSTEQDLRWRNILSPKELPWLKNHALQHQAVFPAAGYIVAAVEAIIAMAKTRGLSITLIEILDFDIEKALAFDSDDSRMEFINTLTDLRQHGSRMDALFKSCAAPVMQGTSLSLHASGQIIITLGDSNKSMLPARGESEANLSKVDSDDLYGSLSKLGYQYTGPFRALANLERKLGFATGHILKQKSQLLIHPAVLDAAFQSLLVSHSAPNSGGIWSLHVPRTIKAIRVNPSLCEADKESKHPLAFDCIQPAGASSLKGDIDLFSILNDTQHAMIQVESLHCVGFSRPSAQDDKNVFATVSWDVAMPDAERVIHDGQPTTEQINLARVLERMAVFYLRHLNTAVPKDHPARLVGPYEHYFGYASHVLSDVKNGQLPLWSSQWENDTADDLAAAYEPYLDVADVRLLKAIGENIVEIATGQKQGIEVTMQDGMLSKMYEWGLGFQEHTTFLARLVKQIVHRYPHLNILEVGAGTGGATKKIFGEIGQRFSSYTFTDISSGFFETARTTFAPQLHKMLYKVLDIGKDVNDQGFQSHSYDLVVASAVLHATPNMTLTLNNVRRLLKPGGFLVVMEPLPYNIARMGAIFGALSGWWLGIDDGRVLSPCIHLPQWDKLLRATGFSGCDTATPVRDVHTMPLSAFVSQAVDSRVEFLRDPLSASMSTFDAEAAKFNQELVILGGSSLQTSRLVSQLKSLLCHQWSHNIQIARSLSEVASTGIHSGMTILSLLDLEKPVFKDLNRNDWNGLKTLLQEASSTLWVSSGRRSENPYANMIVGLLRCAKQEIPTLDIQCFDSEDAALLDVREIAETLLRQKVLSMWHRRDGSDSLLMTLEPEWIREPGGSLLIPRLYRNKSMNDRFNSSRRSIHNPVNAFKNCIKFAIEKNDEMQISLYEVPEDGEQNISTLRVTHSLRFAIRVSRSGFMHLILGQSSASNDKVVAITSEHMSKVSPLPELAFPAEVPAGKEAAFIALLAYYMLASLIFEDLAEGAVAIVHEADEAFAAVITDEAKRRGIHAVMTTTSKTVPGSKRVTLHPMAPQRVLQASVPANTAVLVDLSTEDAAESFGARLRAVLPSNCEYYILDTIFAARSNWNPSALQRQMVRTRLTEGVTRVSTQMISHKSSVATISLEALTQQNNATPDTVIQWDPLGSDVSVQIRPADSQIHFSPSRTYWLAGLSGGLGLLLCEWMIHHGAKHIVISSRRPKIEEAWLERLRSSGACIKIFSCDMTDEFALSAVYKEMKLTLPAVAGVCQGAMVLEDTAIRNMSLEALLKVTRPKVEGSLHLDKLFQGADSDLDFFVFFSSVGSMIGRVGQSNYAAANLFMTALAEQRRRRGQAASVMHIGPVLGVGYISQQGLDLAFNSAVNQKMNAISEHDFLQHFAEAVIAGRPGTKGSPLEVATGLAKFESPDEIIPLLSHYIKDRVDPGDGVLTERSKVPLKVQLADAQGRAQVARIIQEAVLLKLSALFQIEISELERADPNTLRLDEMGIDSLIAVELRSFFVNTLQVNIPVLKILNGAMAGDLIDTAVEMIPRRMVPKIDQEPGTQEAATGKTAHRKQDSPVQPLGDRPIQTNVVRYEHQRVQRIDQPSDQLTQANIIRSEQEFLQEVIVWPVEDKKPNALEELHSEDQEDVEDIFSDAQEYAESSSSDPNVDSTTSTSEPQQSLGAPSEKRLDSHAYEDEDKLSVQTYANSFQGDTGDHGDWRVKSPHTLPTTPGSHCDDRKRVQRLSLPIFDEKVLRLSFSQNLFWFSAAFTDDPTDLNLTGTFRLTGELDIERLKIAVTDVAKQHESLRTRFFVTDGEPMQGIMYCPLLTLEHFNIQSESELADITNEIHGHVYDLKKGDTVRIALVSLSSHEHFFILSVHHLAMDGQSFFPLMKDMMHHYTRTHDGMKAAQYAEFSEKQHVEYASGGFKEELAFWKSELAEMPSTLPILRTSSLTSRPRLQSYGNNYVDVRIGQDTKALIQALCRRNRVTPFHFYIAVFRVLLLRYSGSEDFSIGIGDANRTEDLMGSIGNFVNILPIVFRTESSAHFDKMLQETRSKTYATLANSRVPFQLLLSELGITRSAITTPIFQAFMDYRLARGGSMSWGDYQLDLLLFKPSKVAYDVAVDIIDNPQGECHLTFITRDDLYDQASTKQLADSYVYLVEALTAQPTAAVSAALMFKDVEVEETLDSGRGALYQSRNWGETVVHRVDDIARRFPERTAVMTGDGGVVTYDEIVRKRVDAIATQLLNAGVTTGSRVAVLQEPCPDWVSSILAIMRIGATFVPLDVGLPSARLSAIVKDCQPQAVLANVNTRRRAYELGPEASNIVIVSDNPGSKVTNSATSGGVPAILYTSGSSRTPKGIALTHRGISSWFEPCAMLYGLKSKGEVVLQQSSQGFDMALMQIFTALCFGGSVYLLPQKFRGDARAISDIIARFGVTHTYGTPSEYCSWLRFGSSEMLRNSSWKNALVGGEALAPSVLKAFATLGKDDLRFHHMYGTTESTFCAAVMELDYTDDALEKTFSTSQLSYPAGVALPNYNIYILDEQQNPLTVGLQGEIYIGGAGVAQGYINNSSLTERTFVADPFATADDRAKGWGMMQRTGDLGRWSRVDHGALIVEGRISDDTMVKIRGLRVDLREVEVAFLHAGAGMISEVIVSTRRGSPESPEFLVAHVLLHEGILRERLQELRARLELPLYMQPSFIIALDSFPTTASGKRDRKAISTLPLPVDNVNNDDIAWTSTEENLKEVWENVLPADLTKSYNITPETDFFHIGGTSLLLLPLRDNIKTKFGIELQLLDLFEASVLSSLARRIQGRIDKTKDIDWDKETSLRHSMIKVESNMIQVPQSQSKVVILTGGSGYLGKALIHAMIQDPTVKEIHCLGVRRVTSRMDMKNLPKVTLYEGDLCQPGIGLSHSVIDQLFSRADIVIHNGSDISYMKTYQSIRQSNFLVTKDLIEWCMPRMVPFHFISTAGIGNFTPGMALKETSVSSYSPPTDGSMAYTACKWASEVFLEKLVEKHPQWPVHVHRPTLISREDIPELDGMHNILGYARMMGAVPASQGVARGLVNVVQLETVVAGIMKPVLSQGQCSGGVHYSNHMGRLNLPLNNMRKWALERSAGGEVDFSTVHLEEIPMEEWIRKAIELGMHPTMGAVMSSFARRGEVDFPVVTKGDGGM